MEPVADPLAPFRERPRDSAVLVDFDGTLAPIVLDPAAARPLPGADHVLRALHHRLGLVAVVSGRPLAFLEAHLPAELAVCGLYGLEQRRDGVRVEHPAASGWRERVDDLAARAATSAPAGVEVEHKGLSLTLHVRRHPELADEAAAWAAAAAVETGLEVRTAKMSLELHPPVAVDKGTVLEELVGDLGRACYVGDDAGDLPAFDGLDRLAARGRTTLRVAVATEESTSAVVERADLVVDGPEGALALLRRLAG